MHVYGWVGGRARGREREEGRKRKGEKRKEIVKSEILKKGG
jgi:hypothetical protein